jgi:tetratricopeptide (TPR) repeat protein
MIKAFFSYSSQDGAFVQAVQQNVGRPFVLIDEIAFRDAEDLVAAMDRAVQESSIFVLFASRASLESAWVKHEVNEARLGSATGRIKKVLAVLLDDAIAVSELPEWMQRFRMVRSHAPKPVARKIRALVDEFVAERQHGYFVGRSREIATLQAAVAPTDGSSPPQTVCLTGLTGIGRKTLLSRVARDSSGFERLLRIDVESGDALKDVAAKVANQVGAVATATDALKLTQQIQHLEEPAALERLISDIAECVRLNELPVLYDRGGLLDDEGHLTGTLRSITDSLNGRSDCFVALVSNRRPLTASVLAGGTMLPVVDVRPLSSPEVRQLIALMARGAELTLTPHHISSLAREARGYPPSANFALELARTYGPDAVLSNPSQLIQFRVTPLVRYLRSLSTDGLDRKLLRLLADNSPLPLPVLQRASKANEEEIGKAIFKLIDMSLVVPTEAGWYEIAEPIIDAVQREYQPCERDEFQQVAEALEGFLDTSSGEVDYLALQRVQFRALALAEGSAGERSLALVADWIRVAGSFYHRRDYERSANFAKMAVEARQENTDARVTLIKALIRLGDYSEAEEHIVQLSRQGKVTDANYHRGFLERHRGNFDKAVEYYLSSLGGRRGGVAVHRELAYCYLRLGDFDRANAHIEQAQERQVDNKYIVDLRIQIACKRRDEETARGLLSLLADVDDPVFAGNRRSRVEYEFGNLEAAYQIAKEALEKADRPPFELLANYTLYSIRTERLEEALHALDRLEALYPRLRRDVRLGLRARAAIVQRRYNDAIGYHGQLLEKNRPIHMAIRRDALRGLLDTTYVAPDEKKTIEQELDWLEEQLGSQREVEFDLDPEG